MHSSVSLLVATLALLSATVHAARAPYSPVKMLCLVNRERSRHNLPPLGIHPALEKVAHLHSGDQARRRQMTHESSTGKSLGTRCAESGYGDWRTVGENVAYGYPDEIVCMDAWMKSPGHRENILNPKFTHFGSGVQYSGETPYYTQDFGGDGKRYNFPECPGEAPGYQGGDEYEGPVTGGPYPVPRGPGGHAGRRPVLESHAPSHANYPVDAPMYGGEDVSPHYNAPIQGGGDYMEGGHGNNGEYDGDDEVCDADYDDADGKYQDRPHNGGSDYPAGEYSGGGDNYPSGGDDYPSHGGDYPSHGGDNYPSHGGDNYPSHGGDNYPSHGGDNYPSGGDNYPSHGGDNYPSHGDDVIDEVIEKPAYGGGEHVDHVDIVKPAYGSSHGDVIDEVIEKPAYGGGDHVDIVKPAYGAPPHTDVIDHVVEKPAYGGGDHVDHVDIVKPAYDAPPHTDVIDHVVEKPAYGGGEHVDHVDIVKPAYGPSHGDVIDHVIEKPVSAYGPPVGHGDHVDVVVPTYGGASHVPLPHPVPVMAGPNRPRNMGPPHPMMEEEIPVVEAAAQHAAPIQAGPPGEPTPFDNEPNDMEETV